MVLLTIDFKFGVISNQNTSLRVFLVEEEVQ